MYSSWACKYETINNKTYSDIHNFPQHYCSCSSVGRVGGGGAGMPPPAKSAKLLQKSGVIYQGYRLSQRRQNPKKYLVKNCEKSQFSIEILIKKSDNFHEIFQNFLHFCPNALRFAGRLIRFTCPIEIIHQILMILHFSKNSSRFSSQNSIIFMPFSMVIYLSYF